MDALSPAPWPDEENELEEEEEDFVSKKLVFDGCERPDILHRASKKQSVLVFLRVRPKTQREIMSIDASCLHVVNQRELQAVAPETSQTYKNKAGVRCPAESSQLFTFTHIFDEQATQRDVFEESMLPTMRDFFGGQNCLVFTYGVTNSGKTYTVMGTASEPGILPRSLDLIFNSLSPQQLSSLELRPKNFSEAVYLTDEEMEKEMARKEDILNKARALSSASEVEGVEVTVDLTADSSDTSSLSKVSSNYSKVSEAGTSVCEMQVQDGSTVELEDASGVCYSLWVSFAEIYNELIYDLLAEEQVCGNTKPSRPSLRLAEDRNHNHFIKGLMEVKVSGVEEAMLLLKVGLQHRHVASTRLNYQSSRSHTIFTVKMMKVASGSKRPHNAFVNRISIVDLAGAERSKETGARGLRVREAGNINNSLLTLGKCIEAMRHNQNKRRGEDHVVPFRESKLTRLFQNYLVGKGKGVRQGRITMLVNVSNSASVFDETSHVLKFSAITSKIIPVVKTPAPHKTPRAHISSLRPTTCLPPPKGTPRPVRGCRIITAGEGDRTVEAGRTVSVTICEACESTRKECMELRERIKGLEVEKMESEFCIRQQVCREFQEQLTEIEETHRAELEEQAEDMQMAYEQRMNLLQKSMKKQLGRKRCRVDREKEEEEEGERDSGRGNGAVEARLRENISALEDQLQTEKEKSVVVSAEFRDAQETHESRVICLNQQMNSVSLKLTEAERQERQLREDLGTTIAAADEAALRAERQERQLREDLATTTAAAEEAALRAEERERELVSNCESLQRQRESEERERRAEADREAGAVAEVEILQARISELIREAHSVEPRHDPPSRSPPHYAVVREKVHSLLKEVGRVRHDLRTCRQEVSEMCVRHGQQLERVMCSEADRQVSSEQCRASLEEQVTELRRAHSTLQQELGQELGQVREERLTLETRLREKNDELEALATSASQDKMTASTLSSEVQSLTETVEQLRELQEKTEMEHRTQFQAVQERARGAAERECELIKVSSEQCRASLEEQVTELKKAQSTLQQELGQVMEERLTLETQLREKNDELEVLATSASQDKMTTSTLSSEFQSLTETVDQLRELQEKREVEHRTQLQAVQETARGAAERLCKLMKVSSEQCRASLEEQVTELRKALSQVREERLTLETQLKEKNDELEALATSASQDKMTASTLSSEVQSLTKTVEQLRELQEKREMEHRTQLQAVQERARGAAERECELIKVSSEQCRASLEEQVTELRKAHSTLQQELSQVREERLTLETQLREKNDELEALATSASQDKMTASTLSSEVQSLTETVEQLRELQEKTEMEHRTQLQAVQERAQATAEGVCELKVSIEQCRASLEEQMTELRKAHSTLQQELGQVREERLTLETQLREKNDELEALAIQEKTEMEHRTQLQAVQESQQVETGGPHPQIGEKIDEKTDEGLQPEAAVRSSPDITQLGDKEGSPSTPLPRSDSKPYVAVLDRSSQLMEDTFSEEPRVVIDATPPVGKRGRRVKKRKSSEEEEGERKKGKYQLRNRKKHKRILGDEENYLPRPKYQLRNKKHKQILEDEENYLPRLKTIITKKLTSITSQSPTPPPPPSPPTSRPSPLVVRVTRCAARRPKALRKSQISGPLGLVEGQEQSTTATGPRSVAIGPRAPPLYFDHQY